MHLNLSYKQQGELHRILLKAFPTSAALDRLVKAGLECSLAEIASNSNLQDQVADVFTWVGSRDKFSDLITTACTINPDNAALSDFAVSVGLPQSTPTTVTREASTVTDPPSSAHGGIHFSGPTTINGPVVGNDVNTLTYTSGVPTHSTPSASATPPRPSTFAALKRKNMEAERDGLIQQYEALAQQLLLELDGGRKVVLTQKLTALEQKIEGIEQQLV